MSGHNKFSKIKHKKASTDAKKSKVFSRYSKLITVESKKCNGDINSASLARAIELARKENVPKDVIEKAIAKGTDASAVAMESVTYEVYGPGGTALIISTLTDSKNRTAAEMRHMLSKLGYELASPGSALWTFTREEAEFVPTMTVDLSEDDMQKMVDLYQQLDENDDVQKVYTNAAGLEELLASEENE